MNYTNGGYFCKNCTNYIPKDEFNQHDQICKNFNLTNKKNQNVTEFDYGENINKNGHECDEYYNLSDAMITFGKNTAFSQAIDTPEGFNPTLIKPNQINANNQISFKKTTSIKNIDKPLQMKDISSTNSVINNKNTKNQFNEDNDKYPKEDSEDIDKLGGVPLYNKIGENNSFLIVVIQAIWNMKTLRNYIMNDMVIKEDNEKHAFIINLRALLKRYQQTLNSPQINSPLNIDKLRKSLSELFQNKRKFLPEQPDDPIDLYFAIINLLHSHYINSTLSEINDSQCNLKCIAHKYFWMDLAKQDECECRGKVKRLYSYHNYVFEIPIDKVFEVTGDSSSIESFKLTFKGLNEISLNELKGKLFLFLKILINKIKLNCPEKGVRCSINQVYKQFYIANLPYYLSFNLSNPSVNTNTSLDVLRTLVLIPKLFDLSSIFEHSIKHKVYYELYGGICSTNYKSYSCFFNQRNKDINDWVFFEDQNILYFKEYSDLLKLLVKLQHIPILLIYKIVDRSSDTSNLKELSQEQISRLERLAISLDNFNPSNKSNRFRPNDDTIRYDNLPSDERSSNFKRNNLGANQNSSTNNSSIASETSEYTCVICAQRNKVENKICVKCNKNNESHIKDLLLFKRKSSEKTSSAVTGGHVITPFNNIHNHMNSGEKDSDDSSFKSELQIDNKITSIKHNKNTIDKLVNPFDNHVKITNSSSKPKLLIAKNSNNETNTISSDSSKKGHSEKNINMPKQISNNEKISNKIREDSANKRYSKAEDVVSNEDLCKLCKREKKYKCICPVSLEMIDKKKPERTAINEDRIKPFKKEDKPPVAMKSLKPDEWECDICDTRNKYPNYKCTSKKELKKECQDINRTVFEKYKQKEFYSNQKEILVNNERDSIKQRGLSEKKTEKNIFDKVNYNTANNNTIKRDDSTSKIYLCKCKYDEDNLSNYNIVCKNCKKKRPERPLKTNKEITANIQKLTQELTHNKIEDKHKKSSSKMKYIGDDSFKHRSSSQNNINRDSKAGNVRYTEEDKSYGIKKQVTNNALSSNYNSVDPRLNMTKKKV